MIPFAPFRTWLRRCLDPLSRDGAHAGNRNDSPTGPRAPKEAEVNYKYITAMSSHYGIESTKIRTNIEMKEYFDRLEKKLKDAIAALELLERPNSKPQQVFGIQRDSGRIDIKNMAQKFEQAAAIAPQLAMADLKRASGLRRDIANLKRWLLMEGLQSDEQGNIVWPAEGEILWKVVYDQDPILQDMRKIRFANNRMYCLEGDKEVLLDTRDMVTHFSGPGYAIYVMSASGGIYVSSHSVGRWHHSSLLGGGRVAGAGELRAKDGALLYLSNKSGHYVPTIAHFFQVVHQFEKHLGPLSSCPVTVYTDLFLPPPTVATTTPPKARDERFTSLSELEQALQSKQVERRTYDYEYSKLFRYAAHLSNHVFSTNSKPEWRMNIGTEAWGVYTQTGFLVPPKDVRRWLKGVGKLATIDLQFPA